MNSCLFCDLVNATKPSYKVYEDTEFIVMLDIHPINPGHLLVVTKEHVESYYDLDDNKYSRLMLLVKNMSLLVKQKLSPLKVVITTSGIGNKHVHIHVVPVHTMYDIIPKDVLEKLETNPTEKELQNIQTILTDKH